MFDFHVGPKRSWMICLKWSRAGEFQSASDRSGTDCALDLQSNALSPMQSQAFLGFCFGVGPEIADFGPLPGPARLRGSLRKVPAAAPLD